jgi:hypothetical protein
MWSRHTDDEAVAVPDSRNWPPRTHEYDATKRPAENLANFPAGKYMSPVSICESGYLLPLGGGLDLRLVIGDQAFPRSNIPQSYVFFISEHNGCPPSGGTEQSPSCQGTKT